MSTDGVKLILDPAWKPPARGDTRCHGAKRYGLRCEREGTPADDGLFLCHQHEHQREFVERCISFDESRAES